MMPYIRGLSEAIQNNNIIILLSDINVKVLFRLHTTLRQQFVHLKDPVPTMNRASVVYSIPCSSCSTVYNYIIGRTSRTLDAHLREHKMAVK